MTIGWEKCLCGVWIRADEPACPDCLPVSINLPASPEKGEPAAPPSARVHGRTSDYEARRAQYTALS